MSEEINIDAENVTVIDGEVDEFHDTAFHDDDSEDSAEGSEEEWTSESEISELQTLPESQAIEAAILVQESLQTQAEQEQAESLEVVAAAAVEQMDSQSRQETMLNIQLEAISNQLAEIRNLIRPPLPETVSESQMPSLEAETEPTTETVTATVEVEPVEPDRTEAEPEAPSRPASKRGRKWRARNLR